MKKRFRLSTSHIIMLSFLSAILLGSLLLSLPISSASGKAVSYLDALFTATTSTCVTGLVVAPTFSTWSLFGQLVILVLIQIGGLGVLTVLTGFTLAFHRRMGLGDHLLMQDAFNLSSLSDLKRFILRVIAGTFAVEGVGALLYMTVFVPQFGARGVYLSIFTSISAFCNAGIDVLGEVSLCDYATNPVINLVTMALIVLGGIGYIVWWDVVRVIRQTKGLKTRRFSRLTLHSKIALTSTLILILVGALCFFVLEYNNPQTMKDASFLDRLQLSFFQSVTVRTAGFATLPQEAFTNASSVISLLLMFIGGSPVGTAGGVKTVTVTVLLLAAISEVRSKEEVSIFHRSLSRQAVSKAIAVVMTSFAIVFLSTVALAAVTDRPLLDVLYETVSATGTVGLSRNLTPHLNAAGKWILIAAMYLGRVGPISLAVAFRLRRRSVNAIKNPAETISVG